MSSGAQSSCDKPKDAPRQAGPPPRASTTPSATYPYPQSTLILTPTPNLNVARVALAYPRAVPWQGESPFEPLTCVSVLGNASASVHPLPTNTPTRDRRGFPGR